MLKKYTFWLRTAAVLQMLTAALHSISFIAPLEPQTAEEKQMLDLMTNYHMDGGMGFHPTMHDLFTALSAAMLVLYVFGALITWHLLRKKVDVAIMRGVVRIEVLAFGVYFFVTLALTFPLPIISTGPPFVALLLAWATLPKAKA